jgi:predicted dehydrogenase
MPADVTLALLGGGPSAADVERACAGLEGVSVEAAGGDWRQAGVDGVIAASAPGTVHSLAREALEAGVHVFACSTLADTSQAGRELADLADARALVLMPSHTALYARPVVAGRTLIEDEALGEIQFASCTRFDPDAEADGAGVLRDLGADVFATVLHWLGEPAYVRAIARDAATPPSMDVALVDLLYPNGTLARVELSSLAAEALSRTLLVGTRRTVVFEGEGSSRLMILGDEPVEDGSRPGDDDGDEPLALALADFAGAIRNGAVPRSNAALGVDVLRLIEAAEASLLFSGASVPLDVPPEERRMRPDRRRSRGSTAGAKRRPDESPLKS